MPFIMTRMNNFLKFEELILIDKYQQQLIMNLERNRHNFDLVTEITNAYNRLLTNGIQYPEGFLEILLHKYTSEMIKYPRILMRLGVPNIRKHFAYNQILQRQGKLLDYGCGPGNDLWALISDGYPPELISGYDVEPSCIQIGFDFYQERSAITRSFRCGGRISL